MPAKEANLMSAALRGATVPAAKPRTLPPELKQHAQMVKEAHQHLAVAVPEYHRVPARQRMMMAQEHVRARKGR